MYQGFRFTLTGRKCELKRRKLYIYMNNQE